MKLDIEDVEWRANSRNQSIINMTMNLQIPRHMRQAYLTAWGLLTFQENSVGQN